MSGIKLLRNIFNLHPGEGPLVFLMMVISAANGIAINYYFTASSTLFIEHFDIQILPWTIIASGVALYATQIIYSFFQKRLAATNFLLVSLIFVVAMLAAISISLALIEAPWLIFVIVVLFRVMILVIIIGFWSLANRLFTLLQGKRLYPVVSAGDVISISIGSFLLPFIVRLIGVENLFLIVMVSIIINIASVLIIQGKYRERLAETEPLQVSVPQQRQGNPLRSYYILLIFVLFVVGWTFNYALDYAFLGQLQSRYSSDPEQVAGFIGIMFGIIQLTNFVLKFFFSGRLVSRYGLRFGLFIGPIVITLGVLSSTIVGVSVGVVTAFFWLIAITKYSEEVLRESFNEGSVRILYQPLPAAQRNAALSLVEGNGFPITAFVAGGILVLFTVTDTYSPLRITVLMLALGILWLTIARLTYREYTSVLRNNLDRRTLHGDQQLIANSETIDILKQKLKGTRADEVVYALTILEEMAPEVVTEASPDLLNHESADVQVYVLNRIEKAKIDVEPSFVWQLAVNAPSMAVREAALRAFGRLAPNDLVANAETFMASESTVLQRGLLVSLLRYGGDDGAAFADEWINRWRDSDALADHINLAEVLGEARLEKYDPLLGHLLADADVEVKQAALLAAGGVKHPQLWDALIDALASPTFSIRAMDALSTWGSEALPQIDACFTQNDRYSRHTLLALVRVCRRIGSPATNEILKTRMGWEQPEVRSEVLQTLALNHYRTDADQIKPYLRVDAEEAARHLMLLAAIEDKPDHSLVVDTLNDQLVSARDRMLFLFSLVYEMLPILQARSMLHLGSDAERDYAIEVINIQVPHDMKAFIQPLLAPGLDTAARLQQIKSVVTISDTPLEILLINAIKDETQMPWLRAVLLQAAQQLDIHLDVDSNTLVWQETITMLSTIERVLILKTVHLFSSIPDHILAELAGILEEQRFSTGETIFKKGDFGSSMFVIVRGKVRAHDGHVIFNTLSDREVFGELAVLDTEPRTASISAVEETHVFRLDQAAFYQVMADYPQISQGVIRTLLGYLRARIQDISELNARIQEAS